MSNQTKRNSLFFLGVVTLLLVVGCENHGTVERAGDNLGRGLKNFGEEIDQAAGNVKRVIDNHATD